MVDEQVSVDPRGVHAVVSGVDHGVINIPTFSSRRSRDAVEMERLLDSVVFQIFHPVAHSIRRASQQYVICGGRTGILGKKSWETSATIIAPDRIPKLKSAPAVGIKLAHCFRKNVFQLSCFMVHDNPKTVQSDGVSRHLVFPVDDRITHGQTDKVDGFVRSGIVINNYLSKIRSVEATVRFACNVERRRAILGPDLKNLLHNLVDLFHSFSRGFRVFDVVRVEFSCSWISREAKPCHGWLVHKEAVVIFAPREAAFLAVKVEIDVPVSDFAKGTKRTRTSGTALEPDHEGGIFVTTVQTRL
mmetsp:Transcript_15904/g.31186  ORF Transcript_15904/g.31186 Transcript_15904/m.31186 type:complete len:302 (+) Transcript_15904:642-1547(+)